MPVKRIVVDEPKGPVPFFNSTRSRFALHRIPSDSSHISTEKEDLWPQVEFKWSSRNNRKGRHKLVLHKKFLENEGITLPPSTTSPKSIAKGILKMAVFYPYWNISWWVAVLFTLGSVIWVINAFFAWFPYVVPRLTFKNESTYGGGITAFIGATVFEIGSVLLILEAINENRTNCFGWAVDELITQIQTERVFKPQLTSCTHLQVKKNSSDDNSITTPLWQWWPTWQDLKLHYFKELGFLAGASQLFGATIFWISGFTALPGINNKVPQRVLNGVFWVPQIVGGSGFVVSSLLYMLEAQKKWYQPAVLSIGWQIGFWNLIGAVGFTVSYLSAPKN